MTTQWMKELRLIDSAGRLTVPPHILKALGWQDKTPVELRAVGNTLTLTPVGKGGRYGVNV